VFLVICSAEE